MSKIDRYVHAGTRNNTRLGYQSALRHYEVEWGGFLPATADNIANYLADYAETLSTNTLRQRLAAIARWHSDQGFPDPTKAPLVRQVLRGIQEEHPMQEKQAKPFQMDQLAIVDAWLEGAIAKAQAMNDRSAQLRHTRDRALLLVGFWRGFRGDELARLQTEYVQVVPGEGMTCFLPRTKGDRQLRGTTFKAPALPRLCPVTAYRAWVDVARLEKGPVFRAIDRWGHISDTCLKPASLVPLLRAIFINAGVTNPELYSAHSLRRGFASWATSNGWDIKTLMEYVGWKSVQSALRYVDGTDPFARHRIEAMLPNNIG